MNNKEQYVYVMSNPSFKDNVFKIGWTKNHPLVRAKNLQSSGVPTPFKVEYIIKTENGYKLEQKIHSFLSNYRIEDNREFFEISKKNLEIILATELELELTSNIELNSPSNSRTNKILNKLKQSYDDFVAPLKQENTKMTVEIIDKVKKVCISKREDPNCNENCFEGTGWEDEDWWFIKNECQCIEWYIKQCNEDLDYYNRNYKYIKERIGIEQIRKDNKSLKTMINDTHIKLNNLIHKYEWII